MSVYKHRKSGIYHYDFQLGGRRFYGSTGLKNEREARAFERDAKARAGEELKRRQALGRAPLTFHEAAVRYWNEVGQHHKGGGDGNTLWSLEWLEREIGKGTRLAAIDDALVAALVAKRRADLVARPARRKPGSKPPPPRPVSNATVNRSVTEPLRKIITRAAKTWREPVQAIAWKTHLLKEPKERVRELRGDEEARLFAALREDYHPILRFAILTGVRLGEVVRIRWQDVDWGGRLIWIRGKGDKLASIPMPPAVRALIWPLQGQHPELVFTYVARRAAKGARRGGAGEERRVGQRYPITREGLKTAFRRALPGAEVANYRWHDNRHTAATRILRARGNLKIVQELLRHEDIGTTMKYAHVMHEDVLDAMERAATPEQSPEPANGEKENALERRAVGEGKP